MAVKNNRRMTPGQIVLAILKILYLILFVISAFILVLYLVFKTVVKPPEVEQNVEVTLPPAVAAPVEDTGAADTDAPTAEPTPTPTPEVIKLDRKEDFHTFLLLGTDDGNGNADTIMVGSYDVKNNKISVLSVPRDTLVNVSRTVKKINGAYGSGGVSELMNELEDVLGFRPDHYIKVDLNAFVEVVDALGGVYFYVPEDMSHNDGAGFIIDLKEGEQHLDGNEAMQLVRYRGYANADLGRMQTQQKFLQQLAKQVLSWSTVTKVNEFADIFKRNFDTDLSVSELAWFGTQALGLDMSSDVTFTTLPGRGDASYKGINWYYELEISKTIELVNSTVNPYTTDIPDSLFNIMQAR